MNASQEAQIRNKVPKASSAPLMGALRAQKGFIAKDLWLPRNRYRRNIINLLAEEKNNNIAHSERKLVDYIAVSIPLHCADGWCLLGEATSALLKGDWPSAVHLAYYAELRAAMSILASVGIGVFNNRHSVVMPNGTLEWILGPKTHEFVWKALEVWASLPISHVELLGALRFAGSSFDQWLADAGVTQATTLQLIAATWFKTWSLDLRKLSVEHEARNTTSYRPTWLTGTRVSDGGTTGISVARIWRCFEPSGSGGFKGLDRFLLRLAIERGVKAMWTSPARRQQRIRSAIDARNLPPQQAQELFRFLTRVSDGNDAAVLQAAKTARNQQDPSGALGMIARAALLLRLSSAVCLRGLTTAGIGPAELEAWIDAFAIDTGLWDSAPPGDLLDLWEDVLEAIADVESWWTTYGAGGISVSFANLRADLSPQLHSLYSFQRAFIWGVAS